MKDKLKGLIAGILTGCIITTTVGYATSGTFQRDMHFNNIKITLDGNEIIPKDVNGNYVEPFIIDGTTYLPVRGIANALGLGVDWDGNTNTVILSTKTQPQNSSSMNKVIYNQNGIKVTYLGYRYGESTSVYAGDLFLDLLVENNSPQIIELYSDDATTSINGYMIDGLMVAEIYPGKKINTDISFDKSDLDKNGIRVLSDIEIGFHYKFNNKYVYSGALSIISTNTNSSSSLQTGITAADMNLFLDYINIGVESHNSAFRCLTNYINTADDSYKSLFFSSINTANEAFKNAYSMSLSISDLSLISNDIKMCIDIYETIKNGSYSVIELGNLLTPASNYFKSILSETKNIFPA